MPVDVPTMVEFQALAARVTALEGAPPVIPPEPSEGVQAKRIADVVELFGVNTFSSLDEHNQWGSWPADYRPASVIAALKYMTEGTGFAFRLREYHYAGREAMQRPWLQQIVAAIPGTRVAICPGANANTDAVPTMLALADDPACGIQWIEGLNEPNTDFGSGEVPVAQTKAIQDAVWQGRAAHRVLGPSIVAGIPHPEGWITGYCGEELPAINAAMHDGNGHYYPPGCPDLPRTGFSTAEYIEGLRKAYEHPIDLTEFHPTLYNGENNRPGAPGWDAGRDAFYTLLALLRCGKIGGVGLWWYALFDYGTTYVCGLFPKSGSDAPRAAATALRNLCSIVADPGPNARSFTPGRLGVTVEGLTDACAWDLYQTSAGRFFVALWHAAKEPGQVSVPVAVTFDRTVDVIEYNPLDGETPLGLPTTTTRYDIDLAAGVCILSVAV